MPIKALVTPSILAVPNLAKAASVREEPLGLQAVLLH